MIFDIIFAIVLILGACFVVWVYTLTDRGSSLLRDTQLAQRRSRWWLSKSFLARHWPMILMIMAYVLVIGTIASQLAI